MGFINNAECHCIPGQANLNLLIWFSENLINPLEGFYDIAHFNNAISNMLLMVDIIPLVCKLSWDCKLPCHPYDNANNYIILWFVWARGESLMSECAIYTAWITKLRLPYLFIKMEEKIIIHMRYPVSLFKRTEGEIWP